MVSRLLKELGYSLQANRKRLEGAQHPDRNAQFEHINEVILQRSRRMTQDRSREMVHRRIADRAAAAAVVRRGVASPFVRSEGDRAVRTGIHDESDAIAVHVGAESSRLLDERGSDRGSVG
jgi:Rhodopirellula transposase DDE domain